MIILLAATKGGAGKSTLATSLAAMLAGKGADVVLVDADRQATASTWAARREADSSLPRVACFQPPSDNIRQMLLDLDKRYSHVVVDCAGHDSKELRTGLSAAHISLSPFRPSQPDLDTANKLSEMINDARDSLNPGLRSFSLLTLCPTNPSITEMRDALDYLMDVNGMTVIPTCIHDRKAYRDAICDGKGVTEQTNEKASSEMAAVWEAINGKV